MLYLHYENIQIAGENYVKLLFSSSIHHMLIDWRKDKAQIEAYNNILKQIPSAERTQYPYKHSFIWTIKETRFNVFKSMFNSAQIFHDNETLEEFVDGEKKQKTVDPIKPEDFFYNTTPVSKLPSKIDLQTKLVALLEVPSPDQITRKAYLLACRRLHPDFGGDAQKMSELNSVYQQYTQLI